MVPKSETGLETDLGGIYLVTSIKSLTPGPVPAAEPRDLPWQTPKGPAAQQKKKFSLLLLPVSGAFPIPSLGEEADKPGSRTLLP